MDWFENASYDNFIADISDNKCVIFGTGVVAKRAVEYLKGRINVAYAVDNNFWHWENEFQGIPVKSPQCLAEENLDKTVVLICINDVFGAANNLERLGVKRIYAYPTFFEEVYRNSGWHSATIRLNPSADNGFFE